LENTNSMSSASTNRKRNRWSDSSEREVAPPPPQTSIPDDAAIQALLNEAQTRQTERQQQHNDDQSKKKRVDEASYHKKSHVGVAASKNQENVSYYGPASPTTATHATQKDNSDEIAVIPVEKPNFGVSGALAKDVNAGNMYRGVLLKFQEPPEARAPNTLWVRF
jgi:hypothetical protein